MEKTPALKPPLLCLWIVQMAAWIVPARDRVAWRTRWDASLWNWWVLYERGELNARDQAGLLGYAISSLTDAFWLRITPAELRTALRKPESLLLAAVLVLALVAGLSRGLAGSRALLNPLPVAAPQQLVSIAYWGTADDPFGVPPRLLLQWRRESRNLTGLAGFVHRPRAARAWVTTDFFDVLGARMAWGRGFRGSDARAVVLSYAAWQRLHPERLPRVGETLHLDGEAYAIVGVTAPTFWAIARGVDIWLPLELEPQPAAGVPWLIGAVGRLRPGTPVEKLRTELLALGRGPAFPLLQRAPRVLPFTALPARPIYGYILGLVFAVAVGGFLVSRGRHLPPARTWKYWPFFGAKTGLILLTVWLAWIEAEALIPAGWATTLGGTTLTLAYIVAAGYGLWWTFDDQRRRCPECLSRLALPVTYGSWSSVLESVTTEMMCAAGHGSLVLPETESGESDRWTALDPSWRDLFQNKD